MMMLVRGKLFDQAVLVKLQVLVQSKLLTREWSLFNPLFLDKMKAGRKRDGTPEKPVSPNQSQSQTEEDIVPVSKQVLDGEDIRALAIDHQELAKVSVKISSLLRSHIPVLPKNHNFPLAFL